MENTSRLNSNLCLFRRLHKPLESADRTTFLAYKHVVLCSHCACRRAWPVHNRTENSRISISSNNFESNTHIVQQKSVVFFSSDGFCYTTCNWICQSSRIANLQIIRSSPRILGICPALARGPWNLRNQASGGEIVSSQQMTWIDQWRILSSWGRTWNDQWNNSGVGLFQCISNSPWRPDYVSFDLRDHSELKITCFPMVLYCTR
jgi:hypothetical protein